MRFYLSLIITTTIFAYLWTLLLGYNAKDNWCNSGRRKRNGATPSLLDPNLPIMSSSPYLLSRFTSNIPMPTLYTGGAVRKPKLSVIEILLYNMASLLASIAAGYDVRMSNISPVHPTLLSEVTALKAPKDPLVNTGTTVMNVATVDNNDAIAVTAAAAANERKYATNTYHGAINNNRVALNVLTNTSADDITAESAEELIHLAVTASPSQRRNEFSQSNSHYANVNKLYYQTVANAAVTTATITTTAVALQQHKMSQQQLQYFPSTFSNTSGLGTNTTSLYSPSLSNHSHSHSHTQPPTPSPRRKISTSSFTEHLEYEEQNRDGVNGTGMIVTPMHHFEEFRIGSRIRQPPLYAPADYLRNGPIYSNYVDTYGAGAHRTGYFGSNYFPFRPELNITYERDCKSYPDYSYDYNYRLPDYYNYNYEQTAQLQESPAKQHERAASTTLSHVTRTPPPRVPKMGISAAGHHRTPSTISNNSNIMNQGFSLEHDNFVNELYHYNNLNLNYEREREQQELLYRDSTPVIVPPPTKQELYKSSPKLINRLPVAAATAVTATITTSTSNCLNRMRGDYEACYAGYGNCSTVVSPLAKPKYQITPTKITAVIPQLFMHERPASLPFDQGSTPTAVPAVTGYQQQNKCRSSLRKHSNGSINVTTTNGGTIGASMVVLTASQHGTPTNPTPPDSLTSDDSSYLSAKEGSISSQHSRVHFSPDAYSDVVHTAASVTGNATRTSFTVMNRRLPRRHNSDISASSASASASASPSSSS